MTGFPPFPEPDRRGKCLDLQFGVAMVRVSVAARDGETAGSVVRLLLWALGSVSGATPLPRPTMHSVQSDTSIRQRGRETHTPRGRDSDRRREWDRSSVKGINQHWLTEGPVVIWCDYFFYLLITLDFVEWSIISNKLQTPVFKSLKVVIYCASFLLTHNTLRETDRDVLLHSHADMTVNTITLTAS